MKSEIYNLIILDESGSMSPFTQATISGCNETLNTIRAAQEKHADTQEHFVSIYVFQSDSEIPSRYLIKNAPISKVKDLTVEEYRPYGMTPLYDAVGSTLADMKAHLAVRKLAIGNVTIITDGWENASKHYTGPQVAKMISGLKELGWTFSFIGANIDVEGTAKSLNIDNSLKFDQDEEGMKMMFAKERESRMSWAKRHSDVINECYNMSPDMSEEDEAIIRRKLKESGKGYFSR